MKKLGILGGMGPLATCIFYEKIVRKTYAFKDQDHINTIILSNTSIPDRTDIIINNKNKNLILDSVKEDIKLFEMANVERIAIPCNTFHFFFNDIQKLTNIKIINMVEETVKRIVLSNQNYKTVAVLGTKGTILGGVYDQYFTKYNLNSIPINNDIKEKLMKIIYNVKTTNTRYSEEFNNIIRNLNKNGFDFVIIACTELSCIELDEDLKNFTIDALDVLAEESVKQTGYSLFK